MDEGLRGGPVVLLFDQIGDKADDATGRRRCGAGAMRRACNIPIALVELVIEFC